MFDSNTQQNNHGSNRDHSNNNDNRLSSASVPANLHGDPFYSSVSFSRQVKGTRSILHDKDVEGMNHIIPH